MTRKRLRRFTELVVVSSQADARDIVAENDERIAVVHRAGARTVVFRCPCGCGDTVTINVDPAVRGSWRLRHDDSGITLMPSVWRTNGCESHFIVWRNTIWWCGIWDGDRDDVGPWPAEMDDELVAEWRTIRPRPGHFGRQ